MTRTLRFLFLFLFSVSASAPAFALPKDPAAPSDPLVLPYTESSVHRLALSLGRQTSLITREEGKVIVEALEQKRSVKGPYSKNWNKLLYLSQILTYIQMNPRFFPVGYEFEVFSPNREAYWEFEKGFKAYEKLISRHFGLLGSYAKEPLTNTEQVWEDGTIIDSRERNWAVTTEYLRKTDWFYPSGWEVGSPPFFQPEELQLLVGFLIDLSTSDYGKSNSMTSVHQTSSTSPKGVVSSPEMKARVAVNYLLIQEQFLPVIYQLIDSVRGGGPENFFMMPLVQDHYELLMELSNWNPKTLRPEDVDKLMFEKYALKEFYQQLERQYPASAKEENKKWMREQRLALPDYEKMSHRENWKFRDMQLKLALGLVENRKGDYKHLSIEKNLLQTFLDQAMLNVAYELALQEKIWKLDIPAPRKNEIFMGYWKRHSKHPASSLEQFFKAIGFADQPNKIALVLGKPFAIENPKMKAGDKPSMGFEIEGALNGLTEAILPRDPTLRAGWRWLSYDAKAKQMKKMGFRFDEPYSLDNFRLLTSEFYVDFERFPFLDWKLHLEASGNWEFMSNGRELTSLVKTSKALTESMELVEDGVGIHVHYFTPDSVLKKLGFFGAGRTTSVAKKFAYQMYQHSFWTQIEGYAHFGDRQDNHYLDSWSLDRIPPSDIQRFLAWTTGKQKLNAIDLKYHNVALRPVEGGLDIEFRDNDDDVKFAMKNLEWIDQMFKTGDFGKVEWGKDVPLFMEFKDHPTLQGLERFTLEGALSTRYRLSPLEKQIAHLLQFEISKPTMGQYVYFKDFSALDETPSADLDPAMVRTNFENNVAIPLLNYEEQSFLSLADMKGIDRERNAFLKNVYEIVQEVSTSRKYAFMRGQKDFLHLCEYLERSTHPDRPDFSLRPSKDEAAAQRKKLDELIFRLRKNVSTFLNDSKLLEVKKIISAPGFESPGTPLSQGYRLKNVFKPAQGDCFGTATEIISSP